MTTYVMWEGISLIDNETPIVVLMSINPPSAKSRTKKDKNKSANTKTGFMAQTYIIRQDMKPSVAHKQGLDPAICGDCPMRSPASGGNNACYVNIWRGGNQVWGSYQRGTAKTREEGLAKLRKVFADGRKPSLRIGTYGDPSAAPAALWEELFSIGDGWTGYTHQWRNPRVQEYQKWMMASADTVEERLEAKAMNPPWRTFRVSLPDEEPQPGEIVCPASEEAGKKLHCNECRQCSGTAGRRNSLVDVVIKVHGPTAKRKVR